MVNNNMVESQNVMKSYSTADFFSVDSIVDLPSEVVISQAMRVYFQNARQGTVATKSRSDLTSRSNKKPWRQKGTGKARAGSPRSPLWRGGGVCFGPQPRVRELGLPKKMLRGACRTLFFDLVSRDKLFSLDYLFSNFSTKNGVEILKNNLLYGKKVIFFYDINDIQTYSSLVNINNLNLISFDSINPRALISDAHFVFLNKDIDKLKEVVSLWLQ